MHSIMSISLERPRALRRMKRGMGFLTFFMWQNILGTSFVNFTLILKIWGREPMYFETDRIYAIQGSA
jgi:hypothetical protein